MSEDKKDMLQGMDFDGVELSDEMLDSIAGGYVYHDAGDSATHRREAYYVLDSAGNIIMRLDDLSRAKHWANNLHESTKVLNTDQFNQLRKTGKL